MENIVNKANVKMGGHNYHLRNPAQQVATGDLVMGYSVNHVAGGRGVAGQSSAPAVIGVSSFYEDAS